MHVKTKVKNNKNKFGHFRAQNLFISLTLSEGKIKVPGSQIQFSHLMDIADTETGLVAPGIPHEVHTTI